MLVFEVCYGVCENTSEDRLGEETEFAHHEHEHRQSVLRELWMPVSVVILHVESVCGIARASREASGNHG
jgi:hypothetical protein